jgi:hypothetical protein
MWLGTGLFPLTNKTALWRFYVLGTHILYKNSLVFF